MTMLLPLVVAASVLAAAEALASPPTKTPRREEATVPVITERILSLTEDPRVAIVVDVENVRGKTSFELDHADLLDRLLVWTFLRNCAAGRTLAVIDHGREASAHLLAGVCHDETIAVGGAALCVAFAGPRAKADDVIARDVRWMISSPDAPADRVVVITADQELAWRCRCAVPTGNDGVGRTKLNSIVRRFSNDGSISPNVERKGGKQRRKGRKKSRAARKRQTLLRQQEEEGHSEEVQGMQTADVGVEGADATIGETTCNDDKRNRAPTVEIIAPQRFLEDLEQAQLEWMERSRERCAPLLDDRLPATRPTPVATMQDMLRIRGQILSLESSLRGSCSLRKRHTITGELRKCKEEWREVLASVDAEGKGNFWETSLLARSLSSAISPRKEEGEENASSPELGFSPSTTSWGRFGSEERERLMVRWGRQEKGRRGSRKRERTEDRIILAERLRTQLELIFDSNRSMDKFDDGGEPSLVHLYANYANSINCNDEG